MLPKNIRLHLFIWFWVILSFIFIASFLVLTASGYTVNFKAKTIQKTSMLIITSDPRGAKVFLNNSLRGTAPLKIIHLRPTLYDIRIEKEGYQKWDVTEKLEGDKYIREDAVLFLKAPKISDATQGDINNILKEQQSNIPNEILVKIPKGAKNLTLNEAQDALLYSTDSEIWMYYPNMPEKESYKIIARFSHDISKVTYYSDDKHILFVENGELKIIELRGTNATKLLDIPTSDFGVTNDGAIIYKDGNKTKKATVR